MTRWLRLVAWLSLVALAAVGFWRFEEDDREDCERGNALRREDIPAAFEQTIEDIAGYYGEDPAAVAEVVAENRRSLLDLFPARDC